MKLVCLWSFLALVIPMPCRFGEFDAVMFPGPVETDDEFEEVPTARDNLSYVDVMKRSLECAQVGMVFWEDDGKCYELNTQGPCTSDNEWVLLRNGKYYLRILYICTFFTVRRYIVCRITSEIMKHRSSLSFFGRVVQIHTYVRTYLS